MSLMKYRAFVQDVGEDGYSGLEDVLASNMIHAWNEAQSIWPSLAEKGGLIVLPHSHRHLWPDSKTGLLSAEAKLFVNSLGQYGS